MKCSRAKKKQVWRIKEKQQDVGGDEELVVEGVVHDEEIIVKGVLHDGGATSKSAQQGDSLMQNRFHVTFDLEDMEELGLNKFSASVNDVVVVADVEGRSPMENNT